MEIDRNKFYDMLELIKTEFPLANLEMVAIGMGAKTAETTNAGLLIKLDDGSGFIFLTN